MAETTRTVFESERALGLAIQMQGQTDTEIQHSLEELGELLRTADIIMVGQLVQKRDRVSRAFYLGTGKTNEIAEAAEKVGANLVVADDELTALQIKTIEEATGLPVCDRTSIILDIFARHASTREGKLQVELASLQYQLLHLVGGYENLSRQRGGIGVKGPGETKLETDRRVIKNKLKKLREELDKSVQDRDIQSRKRQERFNTVFSLVGYTNAGKSTLLNRLTGSDVKICDGLFTTLDPTARRLDFSSGRWGILSDTVGFIRKLPHSLIRAFRATLESVAASEVLLVVCDASDAQYAERLAAVEEVLGEIGAAERERLYVFNKIDKPMAAEKEEILSAFPGAIFISAQTGEGIDELKQRLEEVIVRQYVTLQLLVPSKSELVKEIMQTAIVRSQEWGQGTVRLEAEVPVKLQARLQNYVVEP
ncbi:MAG: GTPase HflX [Candidatus Riflebacteria bacterium]|jgi:GTP-binding protein HflX|nr:GTPase HflX [Candidatus Riflebacteria bacterium]